MPPRSTILVLGATGGTGRHFVAHALARGHSVRALVRTPEKLGPEASRIDVRPGSITDPLDVDALVQDVGAVAVMLGDKEAQRHARINAGFLERLVPAMRRQGVRRLLYQAGGLSRPPGGHLSPLLWTLRHTLARGYICQHEDNEAVMTYLASDADDIDWVVHRAGIGSDGVSKGVLCRSDTRFSVATFRDCAVYNYALLSDVRATHTFSFSTYLNDCALRMS